MKDIPHFVLGFERRVSGAFEHAIGLAKNLSSRGYDVSYYANWFDAPIIEINLETGEKKELTKTSFEQKKGIFHLQTHTWEYNGLLDKIIPDSKIIYCLHAILPYRYLDQENKKLFLEGQLSQYIIEDIISNKLSKKQKYQFPLIEKSDHLITINKNHKKALEILGINKEISVFENVFNFDNLENIIYSNGEKRAKKFREKINKENVLLYCGNISVPKDPFGLFNSFKMIKEEYPSSILILLGSGGKNSHRLTDFGLDKRFLEDIVFVPWINTSDIDANERFLEYYLASDVLIQPMVTDELYARTVIDAMGLGIPTITCKSPYCIGSSEDANAIFNSFKYLKEHPEEVKLIINSAKEKVLRENTWDSYIKRLDRIVEGLFE